MAHAQSKSSKLVAHVKCSLHQTVVPQERIYGQEQVAQYYPKLLVGHLYPLSPPVAGSFLQFPSGGRAVSAPVIPMALQILDSGLFT